MRNAKIILVLTVMIFLIAQCINTSYTKPDLKSSAPAMARTLEVEPFYYHGRHGKRLFGYHLVLDFKGDQISVITRFQTIQHQGNSIKVKRLPKAGDSFPIIIKTYVNGAIEYLANDGKWLSERKRELNEFYR